MLWISQLSPLIADRRFVISNPSPAPARPWRQENLPFFTEGQIAPLGATGS
jgi:hypothetical protein